MKNRAQNMWNSFRRDEKIALICCAFSLAFLAGFSRKTLQPQKPFFQNVAAKRQNTIQVHVAGLVKKPGVYQLKTNSRIHHAILLAGGALPKSALHSLNLAESLRDGQKIEVPAAQPQNANASISQMPQTVGTSSSIINVNTASAAELELLPQIGPAIAARIITHRQQHGAFGALEDLDDVKGIGPKTLEKLKGKVSF